MSDFVPKTTQAGATEMVFRSKNRFKGTNLRAVTRKAIAEWRQMRNDIIRANRSAG